MPGEDFRLYARQGVGDIEGKLGAVALGRAPGEGDGDGRAVRDGEAVFLTRFKGVCSGG